MSDAATYEQFFQDNPSLRTLRDLTRAFAAREGSEVEGFLMLFMGQYWHSDVALPLRKCADQLGKSEQELSAMLQRYYAEVTAAWKASPAFVDPASEREAYRERVENRQ